MLLAILPQGTASTALDTSASLNDAIFRLGLTGAADFGSITWISQTELYQFADDAVKDLARAHGLFVVYDSSIDVQANVGSYSLPASHVNTVAAVLVPASPGPVQFLRLTPVRDLWALDANWGATTGNPTRASLDAAGVGTVTLYPNPTAGATSLAQVCQEFPAAIAAGASQISLPTVLQDFFTYAMLAGALGKESDHAMREMAAHYGKRMDLYQKVMSHLWGPAE